MLGNRIMSVMAPLIVKNKGEFIDNLKEAIDYGIEAITVDIWWGKVYKSKQADWSYYKWIFGEILKVRGKLNPQKRLCIVPILSFHKCGGGPGDNVEEIPLPKWLYNEISAEMGVEVDDLRYESETGRKNNDSIPPWLSDNPIIKRVIKSFVSDFANQDFIQAFINEKRVAEINISLGPTGELRYPSYNKSDGWKYPHRGYFQAYSVTARNSFRKWALENGEEWVNKYRSMPYKIRPPFGEVAYDFNTGFGRADKFISDKAYKGDYGKDFTKWYHESLLNHCENVLFLVNDCLENMDKNIPLGIKIPGIHWQWRNTEVPRIAEITAGLMPYSNKLIHDGCTEADYITGYESFFKKVKNIKSNIGRDIIVHFTALEMDDDKLPGQTSMAQTLVRSVSSTAKKYGIKLSGENALEKIANPDGIDITSWDLIDFAYENFYFSGFTLLRLCESSWETDKEKYKHFIAKHND